MLLAGNAPELEGQRIGWRVGIRVELNHCVGIGEPDRMRVARIQGGIFQQAHSTERSGLWPTATAQPVAAVVGVAATVLPRPRAAYEVQRVAIPRSRIPVTDARVSHNANSR